MFKGLLLCASIGSVSFLASKYIHSLGSVTIALILGIAFGNIFRTDSFSEGIKFAEKRILPAAIALMGAGINFQILSKFGPWVLALVISIIAVTIGAGILISRALGISHKTGILLGIGNAVCGSSAIMASSRVLEPDKEETAITVGTVNLLGIIGIFTAPAIASALHFSSFESGMLIGGSIQAVGQVVASGFSVSDQVGQYSTIIKMYRVLMLGFVVLALQFYVNRGSEKGNGIISSLKIPLFITVFFILAGANSLGIVHPYILKAAAIGEKSLLLTAMSAIGLLIDFRSFVSKGGRVLFAGLINSAVQVCFIVSVMEVFRF